MDNSLVLLGLLGKESSYGYDLKHVYDRYLGSSKPIAYGQVYATLARLIRDGMILALGEESGAGPDRKKYEITEAGRKKVYEWMFTPDIPSKNFQSNLFAKTIVAIFLNDDANYLLDLQRKKHMARMREITKLKQSSEILQIIMYDHALFHIEADLRWIDITSSRLKQLREKILG